MSCIFLFAVALALFDEEAAPSVSAVEDAVLVYRRSVISGHVVVKSSHRREGASGPQLSAAASKRKTSVWFDHLRLRNDLLISYEVDKPARREIYCRSCEGPDPSTEYAIYYSEHEQPKDTRLAIHMDHMGPRWNLPMLMPNMIGMALADTPNLSRYNMESFVGRSDRKEATVTPRTQDGADFYELAYNGLDGERIVVLIDRNRGPSVVRIESQVQRPKWDSVDSVDITLDRHIASGLWYPARTVYERRVNDQITDSEVAEVEVLSLNEPLPRDTFRLAGIGPPAGTPISPLKDAATQDPLSWDGRDIVPIPQQFRRISSPAPKTSSIYTLLFFNAIVFAALAAWVLFRQLLRKPGQDDAK